MIDVTALLTAVRTDLLADATLAPLIDGVFQSVIPATVTWDVPVLELGEQAEVAYDAYGALGSDLVLRLMCHARGPAPGVGSFDGVFAVLREADRVLLTAPYPAGVRVVRRTARIPQAAPVDEQGFLRFQAGNLYRLVVDEG